MGVHCRASRSVVLEDVWYLQGLLVPGRGGGGEDREAEVHEAHVVVQTLRLRGAVPAGTARIKLLPPRSLDPKWEF